MFMKILIAAASKTGTALKCAEMLSEKLGNAKIADLNKEMPDISNYDMIIIGGSIRAGMLHNKAVRFIKKNAEQLEKKKVAFFICCASINDAKDLIERNVPAQLLKNAVCADCFGGIIDIAKLKGMDKFIINMLKKASKDESPKEDPRILTENIIAFAEKIMG